MYFMFGDEADREQGRGQKFFVYGAIFAPSGNMPALHTQMEMARKAAGLANTDSLKFASSTRPKSMTFPQHRDLKKAVMSLAREVGNVTFCAQVTLHELARNKDHDDLVLGVQTRCLANLICSSTRPNPMAMPCWIKFQSSIRTGISKRNSKLALKFPP
jgi:hypothetical protein